MSNKIQKVIATIKANIVFVLFLFVFTATGLYFVYQNFIPALAEGTFSDDFVDIDLMNDNADSRWVLTDLDTDLIVQSSYETAEGAAYLETLNGFNGAQANIGVKKTYSADLGEKQVWYYFFSGAISAGNVKDYVSNVGVSLCAGAVGAADSTCGGNRMTWYACTGDCSTKLTSSWNNIKFYTTDPDATSGSAFDPANTASIALMYDASAKMVAKAGFPSQGWDFMRSGTKITFTAGSASNPVTFQDIKDYAVTENFNSVDIIADTFVNLGTSVQIGDGSAATFFED
ncbi:MAG: hypothetical protein ABIL68_06145, partial [bacterium]